MDTPTQKTADREQTTTLLLDAPLERVWDVWTQPGHIGNWWGPDGFTNTIDTMQVATEGEWVFTMHGPDGANYPNHIMFREVIPYQKLVHEHIAPPFTATITFQPEGEKTLLTWHKTYETREMFEMVEKQYQTIEGFKQTVARLEKYLAEKSIVGVDIKGLDT